MVSNNNKEKYRIENIVREVAVKFPVKIIESNIDHASGNHKFYIQHKNNNISILNIPLTVVEDIFDGSDEEFRRITAARIERAIKHSIVNEYVKKKTYTIKSDGIDFPKDSRVPKDIIKSINSITIENAACFEKITIPFNKKGFTVLVGSNGTGKTTILNSLVGSLNVKVFGILPNIVPLSRDSDKETKITISLNINGKNRKTSFSYIKESNHFEDVDTEIDSLIAYDFDLKLINTGINRMFPDKPNLITGISPTQLDLLIKSRENVGFIDEALAKRMEDFSTEDMKQWIINKKYEYLDIKDKEKNEDLKKSKGEETTFMQFKKRISELMPEDHKISFKDVIDYEPIFVTRSGEIPIGAFSSGFQSILAIYWNILSMLQFYYRKSMNLFDESAIAIIDEIDAHLHPEWQQIIISGLRKMFPNVQFIVATHSPLVVSGCGPGEVVFLKFNDENRTVVIDEDAPNNPKGWLVESLLTGPFNLKSVRGIEVAEKIERLKEIIASSDFKKSSKKEEKLFKNLSKEIELPPDDPMKELLDLDILMKMLEEDDAQS
jgi:predicted ATP-binding protein involved in virulence